MTANGCPRERLRGLLDTDSCVAELREEARQQALKDALDGLPDVGGTQEDAGVGKDE